MAARSDVATDRVSLGSAPSMAAITVCGWFKINSASAGSFNTIWRFSLTSGDGTTWILAFRGTNGRTPTLYSPSNTTGIAGAEVALSTYVFLAATLSGTAAQLLYGLEPGGSLTKVTGTVAAGTTDRFTVFGRSPGDGTDALLGDGAYLRIFDRVLSDVEIAAESSATAPVSATNRWANWAFAAAALTDSVAARNFTAGTTALSSVADPALTSTKPAALAASATASMGLGAFATRTASLAAVATAQASLAAFATRPAALNAQATAQVGLTAVVDRTAALGATSTASMSLAAVVDRTAALAVTVTASAVVDAFVERAVALAAEVHAYASFEAYAERPAALVATAVASFTASPVHEVPAALAAVATASWTMVVGGQTPAALDVVAVAGSSLAAARVTLAALTVTAVAEAVLASVLQHPAALAAVAQARVDLAPARDLDRALAAVARAFMALEQTTAPGSLLLDLGEPEYLAWVAADRPRYRPVLVNGRAQESAWLISGAGRPA